MSGGLTLREMTEDAMISRMDSLEAEIIENTFKCVSKLIEVDFSVYLKQSREEKVKMFKEINKIVAYCNAIIENINQSRVNRQNAAKALN